MLTGILSGVSGEYFVAAELSRRGYIASITLRNSKGVDILCSNEDASKSVAIQVKTNQGRGTEWVLNKKSEDYFADNLFYVFVSLNGNKTPPDYFVVPSKTVADFAKAYHKKYLSSGHKDNPMRKFRDMERKYQNRWDLLSL